MKSSKSEKRNRNRSVFRIALLVVVCGICLSSAMMLAFTPMVTQDWVKIEVLSFISFIVSIFTIVVISDPTIVTRHVEATILVICAWIGKHFNVKNELIQSAVSVSKNYKTYRGIYLKYILTFHEIDHKEGRMKK